MSLRKKVFLFIIIVNLFASVLIYLVTNTILLRNLESLEKTNVLSSLSIIDNAIKDRLTSLSILNGDYSIWNDTYEYMIDKNEEYIESNLSDQTFISASLEAMIFVDNERNIVFAKAYDLGKFVRKPVDIEILEAIPTINLSNFENGTTGIIESSSGPLLFSARPILTSEKGGPSRGMLIITRDLNKTQIDNLRNSTGLNFDLVSLENRNLYPAELPIENILVSNEDHKIVKGYKILRDIHDKPIMTIVLAQNRDLYNQGQQTANMLMLLVFFIGATALTSAVYFIDQEAILPINALSLQVRKISDEQNLSTRLKNLKGKEFNSLIADFNKMLDIVQTTENDMKEANKKLQEKSNELEKINRLMVNRELKMINLKQEIAELKEKANDTDRK